MNGHLIIFEGSEGSGKTTQAKALYDKLQSHSEIGKAYYTSEPGSNEIGNPIRSALFGERSNPTPLAEFFLFCADRAQHIKEVINPLLKEGSIVICDRFSLSTIAYQLVETPLSTWDLWDIESQARSQLIDCNITQFLLDVDYDVGFGRLHRDLDRMESKGSNFHCEVVLNYRMFADLFPTVKLDGNLPQETITNTIWTKLKHDLSKEKLNY